MQRKMQFKTKNKHPSRFPKKRDGIIYHPLPVFGKSPPKLCIMAVVQLFSRTASAQSFEQEADVIHVVHDIFCGAAVRRIQITDSGGKQDAV